MIAKNPLVISIPVGMDVHVAKEAVACFFDANARHIGVRSSEIEVERSLNDHRSLSIYVGSLETANIEDWIFLESLGFEVVPDCVPTTEPL